jgi:hypothetical protein
MKRNQSSAIKLFIFIVPLILFMLVEKVSFAQEQTEKDENNWSVEVSFKSAYDNNILKYSDKYLDRFVNNEDEGRFHINKYDDLTFDYSARIAYSKNILKNLRSIISARFDLNQYSFNTIKSWVSYNLGWQQYISKKTSIMLSYSYLPDFYISHYRDDDWTKISGYTPETFQPYSFLKTDYSFWLQHVFSTSVKARLYFSYMDYFYNEHFTEYDSKNIMFGGRIFYELSDKIAVDAGYKYISSNAKGYDEPYETKQNSDDNDATYYENVFSAGIEYQMPKILELNNTISISADFILRDYTTEHSVESDPLHAGRNDFNYRLYFDYNFDILNNFSAGAFFNLLFRDADTSFEMNREYVSDEKDYNQFQLGLDFNYKFQF